MCQIWMRQNRDVGRIVHDWARTGNSQPAHARWPPHSEACSSVISATTSQQFAANKSLIDIAPANRQSRRTNAAVSAEDAAVTTNVTRQTERERQRERPASALLQPRPRGALNTGQETANPCKINKPALPRTVNETRNTDESYVKLSSLFSFYCYM